MAGPYEHECRRGSIDRAGAVSLRPHATSIDDERSVSAP
jgi:hypothetical protein